MSSGPGARPRLGRIQEHLKQIDWGSDGNAKRLHLRNFPADADVIIDPRFGWGAPVLGQSKVKVYDFSGDTIEGDLIKPDGSDLNARDFAKHSSLIRIRTNFIPEIIKSAEDL